MPRATLRPIPLDTFVQRHAFASENVQGRAESEVHGPVGKRGDEIEVGYCCGSFRIVSLSCLSRSTNERQPTFTAASITAPDFGRCKPFSKMIYELGVDSLLFALDVGGVDEEFGAVV